jgi:hypothetical protein
MINEWDHETIHLGAIDGANTTHLPHALYGHHLAIDSQRKMVLHKK